MLRRDFLHRTSRAAAGALLASHAISKRLAAIPSLPVKVSATENVTIGRTDIKISRIEMGNEPAAASNKQH
jgi:hypothetical protein